MVQIIPAAKTKGQRLSEGVGRGLDYGSQLMQEAKATENLNNFRKSVQKLTGIDTAGMDEKSLQGIAKDFAKEQSKYGIKKKLFEDIDQNDLYGDQNDIGSRLSRGQPQQQDWIPGMELPQGQEQGQTKKPLRSQDDGMGKLIPASKIEKYGQIDPQMAARMQKHNDQILSQKQHGEKSVTESFKENSDFINKVQDQYEDSLRKDAILNRMDALSESGNLSESGIINLLETLGLQSEWIKNPANEEYNKLGLDLLGGGSLQADYGSRVLASEFKVSQQRIPTLSQTPEGRKQIAENLKTMLLPAKLKEERLQYYLDRQERTGEPLPHNLRGKILKDIKPQLEEAYDKFKQRNGRYPVREGTKPDENSIEKYYYISEGNKEKAKKMMREDGYDIK